MTLAAAAATAEFVVSLAMRRKSLAKRQPELSEIRDRLGALRASFLGAADRDIEVLSRLLTAQREARDTEASDDRQAAADRFHEALVTAAATPIDLARDAVELLDLILTAIPFATRFTVSDLGAAAALARGAFDAAILMSEVNLQLLGDDPVARQLRDTIARLGSDAAARADEATRRSREKLSRVKAERSGDGPVT